MCVCNFQKLTNLGLPGQSLRQLLMVISARFCFFFSSCFFQFFFVVIGVAVVTGIAIIFARKLRYVALSCASCFDGYRVNLLNTRSIRSIFVCFKECLYQKFLLHKESLFNNKMFLKVEYLWLLFFNI